MSCDSEDGILGVSYHTPMCGTKNKLVVRVDVTTRVAQNVAKVLLKMIIELNLFFNNNKGVGVVHRVVPCVW